MSVYGLDFIEDQTGKKHLTEINGILSGMRGFKKIYGDDRVQQKVFDMLQAEYGKLTINDGTYTGNKFKREHPIGFRLGRFLLRISFLRDILLRPNPVLSSKKAETSWITDKSDNSKQFELPFDPYNGQQSVVINLLNEEVAHTLVNPYITEEISRNKFLQYLLLKDSEITENIIKSSLVGLGATNEEELEALLSENTFFVVKPILGSCGRGVQFLTGRAAEKKYRGSGGPIDDINPVYLALAFFGIHPKLKYIEDLVNENDFSFEQGLSIIQPFIQSQRVISGKENYSAIRAIVCNGKFIDAYQRLSVHPRVNLSQDAIASPYSYDKEFAFFCETTVRIFEEKSKKLSSTTFKKDLYDIYLNHRDRTKGTYLDAVTTLTTYLSIMKQ